MKRFLAAVIAVCFVASAMAQSFSLKGEQRVGFRVNWDEATIEGYTAQSIVEHEKDWEVDQPVLVGKFLAKYNERLGVKLPAIVNNDVNYTIELRPIHVSGKGDMTCYAIVVDRNGNEVARMDNFRAEGGHFGSLLNLIGDGMTSAGKQVAKRVQKKWL